MITDEIVENLRQKTKSLKKVKKLSFVENKISLTSGLVSLFPSLQIVLLNFNSISDITPLTKISSLIQLHANSNNIERIPEEIKKLKFLKVLDLSLNKKLKNLCPEIC